MVVVGWLLVGCWLVVGWLLVVGSNIFVPKRDKPPDPANLPALPVMKDLAFRNKPSDHDDFVAEAQKRPTFVAREKVKADDRKRKEAEDEEAKKRADAYAAKAAAAKNKAEQEAAAAKAKQNEKKKMKPISSGALSTMKKTDAERPSPGGRSDGPAARRGALSIDRTSRS